MPSEQSSTSLGDSSCHAAAQSGRKFSIPLKPPTTTFVQPRRSISRIFHARRHCTALFLLGPANRTGWNAESLEEPHSSTLPSQLPSASRKPKQNKSAPPIFILPTYLLFHLRLPTKQNPPRDNHKKTESKSIRHEAGRATIVGLRKIKLKIFPLFIIFDGYSYQTKKPKTKKIHQKTTGSGRDSNAGPLAN